MKSKSTIEKSILSIAKLTNKTTKKINYFSISLKGYWMLSKKQQTRWMNLSEAIKYDPSKKKEIFEIVDKQYS